MADPYRTVAEALLAHDIKSRPQREYQLVVSCQTGPIWPDTGNSFWLSRQNSKWIIATWLPVCYWVPNDVDVVELCVDCMRASNKAMYEVPPALIQKYRLETLTDGEVEQFFPD